MVPFCIVCRVIPSGKLDELLKESVFRHFAVVRNSSFNKTYTHPFFPHRVQIGQLRRCGRSACGFFRFLLTEMMVDFGGRALRGIGWRSDGPNTTGIQRFLLQSKETDGG